MLSAGGRSAKEAFCKSIDVARSRLGLLHALSLHTYPLVQESLETRRSRSAHAGVARAILYSLDSRT
eukprot:2722414-Alexandrium_andersonii.AAC.1